MKMLFTIAAASAFALSIGATAANAGNGKPAQIELCHFPGHQAVDRNRPDRLIGDFPLNGEPPEAVAFCEDNGGKIITVACPGLKGHLSAPNHIVDRFCEVVS